MLRTMHMRMQRIWQSANLSQVCVGMKARQGVLKSYQRFIESWLGKQFRQPARVVILTSMPCALLWLR